MSVFLCEAEKMITVLQSQRDELVTMNYWQEEVSPEAVGQWAVRTRGNVVALHESVFVHLSHDRFC